MRKIHRIILPVFILLACCLGASAQAPDQQEIRSFQQLAGDKAALYSGREAMRYDFAYNGHPYWETPEFRLGDIDYEGRHYCDLPLNIDAYTQHALLRFSNDVFIVALAPGAVTAVDIDGHHFVGIGPDVEGIDEGFYDVLGAGPEQVYKRVTKLLQYGTDNVNGQVIGYEDPNYRREVTTYFAYKVSYFFRDADGNFSPIRNRAALIRKFPARKKEIRRAVHSAGLDDPAADFSAFCEMVLRVAAL